MTTPESKSNSKSPANRLLRETDMAIDYMISGTGPDTFPGLFVKYEAQLSPDASDWNQAVNELARKMAQEFAPWLVPAISNCCAWKIILAIAKKEGLIPGLRTALEHDQSFGGAAKYKNYPGLLFRTVSLLSSVLGTQDKAYKLLENLKDVEPGLFEWATKSDHKSDIPAELADLARCLYRLDHLYPGYSQEAASKLAELAQQLSLHREVLREFQEKLPGAGHIKDNLARIKKQKEDELVSVLMDEDGFLRERIWKRLETVESNEQEKRQLAISVKFIKSQQPICYGCSKSIEPDEVTATRDGALRHEKCLKVPV